MCTEMCYLNLITWTQCGHFRVMRQKCKDAEQRQNAAYCTMAHEPIATDLAFMCEACRGTTLDSTDTPYSKGVARGDPDKTRSSL